MLRSSRQDHPGQWPQLGAHMLHTFRAKICQLGVQEMFVFVFQLMEANLAMYCIVLFGLCMNLYGFCSIGVDIA